MGGGWGEKEGKSGADTESGVEEEMKYWNESVRGYADGYSFLFLGGGKLRRTRKRLYYEIGHQNCGLWASLLLLKKKLSFKVAKRKIN